MFFSVLGLLAYHYMLEGRRWAPALFVAAATLLFHVLIIYFAVLLATVHVHAILWRRDRLRTVGFWAAVSVLVNLPWIIWMLAPPVAGRYPGETLGLAQACLFLAFYAVRLAQYVFTPLYLVIIAAVALAYRRRFGRFPTPDRSVRSGLTLLLVYGIVLISALSFLTSQSYFRYAAPAIPLLCIVAGLILAWAWQLRPAAGVASLAAVLLLGPLISYATNWDRSDPRKLGVVPMPAVEYFYEITHDIGGPLKSTCQYLNEHARPTDMVAISSGDMTLKFHTPLRVVGGLSDEDVAEAPNADWIVLRRYHMDGERSVSEAILHGIRRQEWQEIALNAPDTIIENREAPDWHRYRPVRATAAPVILLHRITPREAEP